MRRFLVRFLLTFAALVLATTLWYGQSRLLAGWRSLSHHELGSPLAVRTNRADLVVGTFNIAHGRGGQFGASNWTGSSRKELQAHLREIAAQIAAVSPDILVLNEADIDSTWSNNIDQPVFLGESARFAYLVTQRNVDVAFPFLTFNSAPRGLPHHDETGGILSDHMMLSVVLVTAR